MRWCLMLSEMAGIRAGHGVVNSSGAAMNAQVGSSGDGGDAGV